MSDDRSPQLWLSCIEGLPEQNAAATSSAALTVVSAGAGTGKTETLARRFAWLLATDKECTVDHILVLTFTEKAAREMQERIKSTIVSWRDKNPAKAGHLQKALTYIDDASISTIHAFAMKVIRESGLLLDVDPSSSIVSPAGEDVWWKEFSETLSEMSLSRISCILSDDWLRRAEELFADELYSDFINCYSAEALAELSKAASEKLGSFNRTPCDLWNQSNAELLKDIDSLEPQIKEIWNLWMKEIYPALIADLSCSDKETESKLTMLYHKYAEAAYSFETARSFAGELINEALAKLNKIAKSTDEALGELLCCQLKQWRDDNVKLIKMALAPSADECELLSMLNRTAALGWQCWESIRKNEGSLSMNDLIKYAGQALKMSSAYSKKFRHILVDEFQDTDALQNELLKSIWNESENTLFVVGDLKQSIYRFRHADLSIFQSYITKARSCQDGKYQYITLDKSFRTRDALLQKFNCVFGDIWRGGLVDGSDMVYEPLVGPADVDWWQKRNEESHFPEMEGLFGVVERVDDKKNDSAKAKYESVAETRLRLFKKLAEKIAKIRLEARIWQKKEKEFRPCRWSDFALLVPTRTTYPVIERAFNAACIPYVLCTAKDYFSRGEVTDVINLVTLLADCRSPLPLAGWLVSPFSGVGSHEAYKLIEEAAKCNSDHETVPLADVIAKKNPQSFELILKLKRIAEFRGVSNAILEIIKTPEYLKFFDEEQRKKVNANIYRLAEIAEEYELSQGHSISGCAEYLSYAVNQAIQKEEPDVSDEQVDAVNVITIHSSKGLEYPIVILSGTESAKPKPPRFCISLRYGISVKKIPAVLSVQSSYEETTTGLWSDEAESEAELAERERLWYVAATRAREKLILCATAKSDRLTLGTEIFHEDSFISHIWRMQNHNERLLSADWVRISDDELQWSKKDKCKGFSPKGDLQLTVISPAKLQRLSASAYAMLDWCPLAYRISYRQGMPMKWESKEGDNIGSAEFGSLAHHILSRWNFNPDTLNLMLPQTNSISNYHRAEMAVPLELRSMFRSEKARELLRNLLNSYISREEGAFIRNCFANGENNIIFRETPFRVNDKGLILVGATDIFWELDGIINIRDWKTTPESCAPSRYYESQLNFYAFSLWKYRKDSGLVNLPISIGINYLRQEEANIKSRILSDDDMVETGESIHCAAVDGLAGKYEKNCARCQICPWRGSCSKLF